MQVMSSIILRFVARNDKSYLQQKFIKLMYIYINVLILRAVQVSLLTFLYCYSPLPYLCYNVMALDTNTSYVPWLCYMNVLKIF